MAAGLRCCRSRLSVRCLANNVPVKYLRPFVCYRTFPASKPTLPPRRYSYERMFCSDNRKGSTPNDNEENKVGNSKVLSFNFTSAQGPFGWLSKTIKIWLLKRFFDPEFEETEFLRGAKQAVVVITGIFSTKQVDQLNELASLASERFINEMKNRVMGAHTFRAVETGHILSANIRKVQLGYDQEERGKVIEIDVTFFVCKPEGLPKMTLGNMKVIHLPPPDIITCRFRRIVFTESIGDWQMTAFDLALVV